MKNKFSTILQRVEKTGKLPIIVLLKGKAGSKTILKTLKSLNLGHPIWQIHSLSPYVNYWKEQHPSNTNSFIEILKSKVPPSRKEEKLKVISLVRDPIARSISKYFQSFKSPVNSKLTRNDLTIEELIQDFFKKFKRPQCPFEWFDHELKPNLKIDIFEEEFDKEKGYKIYKNDQIELLIIRLENLNSCYQHAFNEFIGIKDFQLVNGNVGENRYYAEIYKEFKNKIVIPSWYIDEAYKSHRFKYFYTDEEIKSFRDKWTRDRLSN